jgi:hypothetical protein
LVTAERSLKNSFREAPKRSHLWPVRFNYLPLHARSEAHAIYHDQLVRTEVLMRRLVSATKTRLEPVNPSVTLAMEDAFFLRPARPDPEASVAEHARWFTPTGARRRRPLSRESLLRVLVEGHGITERVANRLVCKQSLALAAHDQAWLERRAKMDPLSRALNATEYAQLTQGIESIHLTHGVNPTYVKNRSTTCTAAELIGRIVHAPTETPFLAPGLVSAFEKARAWTEKAKERGLAKYGHLRAPLRQARNKQTAEARHKHNSRARKNA